MRLRLVVSALAIAMPAAPLPALANLSPAELANAGVDPPPGARLPTSLPFVDQFGRPARITAGTMPTVLLFADYSCAHLCGPGLTLTVGALHDAGLRAGVDYRLVIVGMDGDGPARARAFAVAHLGGLPDARAAISLLTGSPRTIAAAEQALGYHAVYDASADQFAHDAASFVFTPDGALSHVLPETAVTPAMAARAVRSAARGERAVPQPSILRQVATLCYGLASAHGRFGQPVVIALRIAGLVTIVLMALGIARLSRRRREAHP